MNLQHEMKKIKPIHKPIRCAVEVPGSKSITNRALLLASMAQGKSVLTHVLFSDDSRGCMDCLSQLGFAMTVNEAEKTVTLSGGVPRERAMVNVRSAGTSARFLTAILAACEGEYHIDASEQMKKRPMKPLLDILQDLGCEIKYTEKDGFLPFTLRGGKLAGGEITLDAGLSSQFISALLMSGCMHQHDLTIRPTGRGDALSYVDITLKMMAQFGVEAGRTDDGAFRVKAGQRYTAREYKIEPDVSSACYFYAAAALTGGSVLVRDVSFSSMQGDIKFLRILEKLGCTVTETSEGIRLLGPEQGRFEGIEVDMGDCSDQSLTLAAMAPFAASPTRIKNIRHIKHQESDRISAVLTELSKMGIRCAETEDGILIHPGTPQASAVETYEDHRMAMAFSLIGLRAEGIQITNPSCVSKTFEHYFEVFDRLYT